jgi:hypothetical protein
MTTRSFSIHVGRYPSGQFFMAVLEQVNDNRGNVRHDVYATVHVDRESLHKQLLQVADDLTDGEGEFGVQPLPGV